MYFEKWKYFNLSPTTLNLYLSQESRESGADNLQKAQAIAIILTLGNTRDQDSKKNICNESRDMQTGI